MYEDKDMKNKEENLISFIGGAIFMAFVLVLAYLLIWGEQAGILSYPSHFGAQFTFLPSCRFIPY